MFIAGKVRDFLDRYRVKYEVHLHGPARTLEQAAASAGIPAHQVARAVMVTDKRQMYMLILPLDHVIDFDSIRRLYDIEISLVPAHELQTVFDDCERETIPALGEAYGVQVIVDHALQRVDQIYFEPGTHAAFVSVPTIGFQTLHKRAHWARISMAPEQVEIDGVGNEQAIAEIEDCLPVSKGKKAVESIYELPAMPESAMALLKLRNDPDASIQKLAEIIEIDPSLTVQVLRFASSPFFGYRGKLNSVKDAIARVLGFDMVMNVSLGLAATKGFKNPRSGPLGLNAYWQHAMYSAALMQHLAKRVDVEEAVDVGTAYLAGLLHNFGFLLLGHLFQPEFYLLNKLYATHRDVSVVEIEHQVLGMGQARHVLESGHAQLGSWLMESWNMPEEIIVTAREHHHAEYEGEHWVYVSMLLVVNSILKRHGIGDGDREEISEAVLTRLGITDADVDFLDQLVVEHESELSVMAQQMAA